MSVFTFLIGWLFHEDFVKEQEELNRQQEQESRSRQDEEDFQNLNDEMQGWDDQDENR